MNSSVYARILMCYMYIRLYNMHIAFHAEAS